MKLTEHQEEVLNKSLEILTLKDRLLIKGSAGVGKTFLVNELIKRLKDLKGSRIKKVFCSAPTNKAVAVLRDKVSRDEHIDFITTHSALKLKRNIHYKTGAISFKPFFSDKYPPLLDVNLLIIDESSMLNSELLGYIEEHATKQRTIVIFIGDEKQLNPVNEEVSPVFVAGYPEVELTEIVRQAEGNSIIGLSRNLNLIGNKESEFIITDEEEPTMLGYVYSNDKDKVIRSLAKANGTDSLKYLAYTNREVDTINKLVRQRIYGTPNKIELGETLIFNAPYNNDYFTNEEIKVNTLDVVERDFVYLDLKFDDDNNPQHKTITLKVYLINAPSMDSVSTTESVIVIHEDSEEAFKKLKSKLVHKAKIRDIDWVNYYQFIEQFADLKYNHALTIHKSQGSTFTNVIVNVRNVFINRDKSERDKLLYTSITRASDLLILYNS